MPGLLECTLSRAEACLLYAVMHNPRDVDDRRHAFDHVAEEKTREIGGEGRSEEVDIGRVFGCTDFDLLGCLDSEIQP